MNSFEKNRKAQCVISTVALSCCVLAVPASNTAGQAASEAKPPVAVVSVATRALGPEIPRDFVGFSLEISISGQGQTRFQAGSASNNLPQPRERVVFALGHPGSPNRGYFRFMRNLGTGILRLGGNSQDNTCWQITKAPHPEACEAELKPADLKLFSDAAQASGWRLIVGLNLKQNSPPWALAEITQGIFNEIKPEEVFGLEPGNEPEGFPHTLYGPNTDSQEEGANAFLGYVQAFRADPVARQYAIVGPATCCAWRNARDLSEFANRLGARENLKWLTVHNYAASTCGGNTVTIEQLLSSEAIERANQELTPLVQVARSYDIPIAVAETNSISCGGTPGVSDAFAAALWGLDYMFLLAQEGFVNVDFHTSYRPGGSSYNPVDTYGSNSSPEHWNYHNVAEPLYYSLYLFSQNASGSHLLATTMTTQANIRAYATSPCSGCAVKIFVINKDVTRSGRIRVRLDHNMGAGALLLLTAPKLNSRASDVRYGGQHFNSDGVIAAPTAKSVVADGQGDYEFNLPYAAAAVLSVEPTI